jgi:hypothetical protein
MQVPKCCQRAIFLRNHDELTRNGHRRGDFALRGSGHSSINVTVDVYGHML